MLDRAEPEPSAVDHQPATDQPARAYRSGAPTERASQGGGPMGAVGSQDGETTGLWEEEEEVEVVVVEEEVEVVVVEEVVVEVVEVAKM